LNVLAGDQSIATLLTDIRRGRWDAVLRQIGSLNLPHSVLVQLYEQVLLVFIFSSFPKFPLITHFYVISMTTSPLPWYLNCRRCGTPFIFDFLSQ
jgi:hypothetical protein